MQRGYVRLAMQKFLRVDGDILRLAASYGLLPTSQTRPISRQLVSGRAVIDRQTIHVHDIAVAEDEFPYTRTLGIPRGIRTFLATPLLSKGDPIGAIVIRRTEVRPFSDKQIALLENLRRPGGHCVRKRPPVPGAQAENRGSRNI